MGKRRRMGIVFLLLLLLLLFPGRVIAAENEGAASTITEGTDSESILGQFDFSEIDMQIQNLFPESSMSFGELVRHIISGKIELNGAFVLNLIKTSLFGELEQGKGIFAMILLIGILAAVFSNFGNIFENHQIMDISFYFLYMFLIIILMKTFGTCAEIARSTIENVTVFMKVLIPTFFVVIGMSSGSLTALAFYQVTLFVIAAVEMVLLSVLIPMTNSYMFLVIMNGLSEEERMVSLMELLGKGIRGSLKVIIGIVGGVGFLQSMIAPVIDRVKATGVQKLIGAIPGVGNIADSVTELVLGSAILIKNSIGVALVIILLLICLTPILKIGLFALVIKGSAAIIGLVTDKRMTACASSVGDGAFLLLKIAVTAVGLFIITIAIVITATNKGM